MRSIGSINIYLKIIKKLQISPKPFYAIVQDDIYFEWTPELDKLFKEIKFSLSKYAKIAIPNTTNPFYIAVEASLIVLGAILFQPNAENKIQVISYLPYFNNSRSKPFFTYNRELCSTTFALSLSI